MNNKGFAITTILYGTLILFLMLLLSLLGILSSYKDRLSILIDKTGAARTHIMSAKFERPEPEEEEDMIYCSWFTPSTGELFINMIFESKCKCSDDDCETAIGSVSSNWSINKCTLDNEVGKTGYEQYGCDWDW